MAEEDFRLIDLRPDPGLVLLVPCSTKYKDRWQEIGDCISPILRSKVDAELTEDFMEKVLMCLNGGG